MTNKAKVIISVFITLIVCFCCFSTVTYAKTELKTGIAVVTASSLRLREDNNLSADVLDYAEKGDYVVVLDKVGSWYRVNYNLQDGYMHASYLAFTEKENAELGYGSVCGTRVNMRSGPSTKYNSIGMLNEGDKVYIIGINCGWYKVVYGNVIGYIRSDYVDLTEIPYENFDSTNKPLFFKDGKWMCSFIDTSLIGKNNESVTNQEQNKGETLVSTSTNEIIKYAEKYLGVPYVYGGSSPSGFDCSGLVYYVFRNFGYSISRTASAQYYNGTPISKSNLQPGDLVFFQNTAGYGISHVGIYVGNGKFIHSPSTGKVVSYADLNSTYYTSHYFGACRISK